MNYFIGGFVSGFIICAEIAAIIYIILKNKGKII
jgi:hypothetical protein